MSVFKFIMIGAMYENGGNTTQRLLDGHPSLMVYPFESQPGTKYVNDYLSSMFPLKYRWPTFPSHFKAEDLYESIIDEEGKVRSKTPYVSKFREAKFDMSDKDRKDDFVKFLNGKELARANVMESFFRATFSSWKNFNRHKKNSVYVGYSPIIGVDGEKIINDYKGNAYVIHVMRNPFSAYADTKKRAVPLSLEHYITGWIINQYFASLYAKKYPTNFIYLRYEDIVSNPVATLGLALKKMKLPVSETLAYPSWNGSKLEQVYPWGTIKIPTQDMNIKTALELNKDEIEDIYQRAKTYITEHDYEKVYKKIKK